MNSGDWSDAENDAVVASYFAMLSDELSGRSYNKAAQNRSLQEQTGRGRGSIEFKMCNVSAVFRGFGLPVIVGYQPRFNYQTSREVAVFRCLAKLPEWELSLHGKAQRRMAEPDALYVGTAPTLKNTPPPEELEQMQRVARHF